MLFLERSGYTEETFHTFSYSPIFDDHGAIAGHALRGQGGHRGGRRPPADADPARPRLAAHLEPHRGGDHRHRLPRSSAEARPTCRSRWSTCSTTTGDRAARGLHRLRPGSTRPRRRPIEVDGRPATRSGRPPRRWPARPCVVDDLDEPVLRPADRRLGRRRPPQALVVPLRRPLAAGPTASRSSGSTATGRSTTATATSATWSPASWPPASPTPAPTSSSGRGPRRWPSSTRPRPTSSPTSATSSAPR